MMVLPVDEFEALHATIRGLEAGQELRAAEIKRLRADRDEIEVRGMRSQREASEQQDVIEQLQVELNQACIIIYTLASLAAVQTPKVERLRGALGAACDELENLVAYDDEVTTAWRALLR